MLNHNYPDSDHSSELFSRSYLHLQDNELALEFELAKALFLQFLKRFLEFFASFIRGMSVNILGIKFFLST